MESSGFFSDTDGRISKSDHQNEEKSETRREDDIQHFVMEDDIQMEMEDDVQSPRCNDPNDVTLTSEVEDSNSAVVVLESNPETRHSVKSSEAQDLKRKREK